MKRIICCQQALRALLNMPQSYIVIQGAEIRTKPVRFNRREMKLLNNLRFLSLDLLYTGPPDAPLSVCTCLITG